MELSKLDQFKILLGVAAEEENTPSDAEGEGEMAIKLEASDLESLMARAMASAMEARETSSSTSAQVGAETEVNAISVANPLKSANFWEED